MDSVTTATRAAPTGPRDGIADQVEQQVHGRGQGERRCIFPAPSRRHQDTAEEGAGGADRQLEREDAEWQRGVEIRLAEGGIHELDGACPDNARDRDGDRHDERQERPDDRRRSFASGKRRRDGRKDGHVKRGSAAVQEHEHRDGRRVVRGVES